MEFLAQASAGGAPPRPGLVSVCRLLVPLLLTLPLGAPALAQDYRGQIVEDVAQIFCIAVIADDEAPLRALLTPELAGRIADAEAQDAEIAAKAPDEKPPLGDGIPWQSWPDSAQTCTPDTPILMMDEASIAVRYHFDAAPDADYADTLKLKLLEQSFGQKLWRIDDIVYAGDGTLRDALTMAFMPN